MLKQATNARAQEETATASVTFSNSISSSMLQSYQKKISFFCVRLNHREFWICKRREFEFQVPHLCESHQITSPTWYAHAYLQFLHRKNKIASEYRTQLASLSIQVSEFWNWNRQRGFASRRKMKNERKTEIRSRRVPDRRNYWQRRTENVGSEIDRNIRNLENWKFNRNFRFYQCFFASGFSVSENIRGNSIYLCPPLFLRDGLTDLGGGGWDHYMVNSYGPLLSLNHVLTPIFKHNVHPHPTMPWNLEVYYLY